MRAQRTRRRAWTGMALAMAVCAAAANALPSCGTGSSINAWQCWETTLTSTRASQYTNGYKNVTLSVTYTQQTGGSASFTAYGYWNQVPSGHDQFKIRTAFPAAGAWRWATTCTSSNETPSCSSDSGLNTSGTLTVNAQSPSQTNPLYRQGFLQMSGDGRQICQFVNGTCVPFP